MTELQTLKKKKKEGKASPAELTRLKLLQDGEPLSAADLEVAKKREEERAEQDRKDYEARQATKVGIPVSANLPIPAQPTVTAEPTPVPRTSLDPPPEHPRITLLKDALRIFTRIEAHDSRPDDFVLFTREVSITAGDVRRARKAMNL